MPSSTLDGVGLERMRLPDGDNIARTRSFYEALVDVCRRPSEGPVVLQLLTNLRPEALPVLRQLKKQGVIILCSVSVFPGWPKKKLKRIYRRYSYRRLYKLAWKSRCLARRGRRSKCVSSTHEKRSALARVVQPEVCVVDGGGWWGGRGRGVHWCLSVSAVPVRAVPACAGVPPLLSLSVHGGVSCNLSLSSPPSLLLWTSSGYRAPPLARRARGHKCAVRVLVRRGFSGVTTCRCRDLWCDNCVVSSGPLGTLGTLGTPGTLGTLGTLGTAPSAPRPPANAAAVAITTCLQHDANPSAVHLPLPLRFCVRIDTTHGDGASPGGLRGRRGGHHQEGDCVFDAHGCVWRAPRHIPSPPAKPPSRTRPR